MKGPQGHLTVGQAIQYYCVHKIYSFYVTVVLPVLAAGLLWRCPKRQLNMHATSRCNNMLGKLANCHLIGRVLL